jgi:hypothetical protein
MSYASENAQHDKEVFFNVAYANDRPFWVSSLMCYIVTSCILIGQ